MIDHSDFHSNPSMMQTSNIGFQNNPKFLKKFVSQFNDQYPEYNLKPIKDITGNSRHSIINPLHENWSQSDDPTKSKFGRGQKDRNNKNKNLKNLVFDDEDVPDILDKIKDLQALSDFFFLNLKSKLKKEVVNTTTNLQVKVVNKLERSPKIKISLLDNYDDFEDVDSGMINWLDHVDLKGEDQVKSAEMQITPDELISTKVSSIAQRGSMVPEAFPLPGPGPFASQASVSSDSVAMKIKLGETLESEILDIIKLWKYILNLITNIKEDFEVSCRLIKKLSRETFNHHTADLPDWLQNIMGDWYEELELTLCDEENQVRGSSMT